MAAAEPPVRLAFDDYHRQGAPDAVEVTDLPRDGLLDLLKDVPTRMGG
jgi:hypothetical protein